MKKLLDIRKDEETGKLFISCKNGDEAVLAITNHIKAQLAKGKKDELDFLFSCVVHLLAGDLSGVFERDFITNLRKAVVAYREVYRQMAAKNAKSAN